MQTLYIQGRSLAPAQLDWIRGLMTGHPDWGRFRFSVHIAEQWNWRNGAGWLKDMAARTLLLKLQRRGLIGLPLRVRPVDGGPERGLLAKVLGQFHYLGYRRPVGDYAQLPIMRN